MMTLNTTFHVEEEIHIAFISYMKDTYLSETKYDDKLCSARLCKIHSHHIDEGHSYSIQFTFNTLDELEKWDKTKGRELNEALLKNFEDKITGFSTLLEEIEI